MCLCRCECETEGGRERGTECVSYTCFPLMQYVNCHGTELQSAKRLQTAKWINLGICVKRKHFFLGYISACSKWKLKSEHEVSDETSTMKKYIISVLPAAPNKFSNHTFHLPLNKKRNTNKKQIALNSNHWLRCKIMCGTAQKMLKVSQNHNVYTFFDS